MSTSSAVKERNRRRMESVIGPPSAAGGATSTATTWKAKAGRKYGNDEYLAGDFCRSVVHRLAGLSLKEQEAILPGETLVVGLIEAHGLMAADANGLSDPYCTVVPVDYTGAEVLAEKVYTSVIRKTLTPQWDEVFMVGKHCDLHGVTAIKVKIKDWDAVGSHTSLGEVQFDLEELFGENPNAVVDQWVDIVARKGMKAKEKLGQLHVLMMYKQPMPEVVPQSVQVQILGTRGITSGKIRLTVVPLARDGSELVKLKHSNVQEHADENSQWAEQYLFQEEDMSQIHAVLVKVKAVSTFRTVNLGEVQLTLSGIFGEESAVISGSTFTVTKWVPLVAREKMSSQASGELHIVAQLTFPFVLDEDNVAAVAAAGTAAAAAAAPVTAAAAAPAAAAPPTPPVTDRASRVRRATMAPSAAASISNAHASPAPAPKPESAPSTPSQPLAPVAEASSPQSPDASSTPTPTSPSSGEASAPVVASPQPAPAVAESAPAPETPAAAPAAPETPAETTAALVASPAAPQSPAETAAAPAAAPDASQSPAETAAAPETPAEAVAAPAPATPAPASPASKPAAAPAPASPIATSTPATTRRPSAIDEDGDGDDDGEAVASGEPDVDPMSGPVAEAKVQEMSINTELPTGSTAEERENAFYANLRRQKEEKAKKAAEEEAARVAAMTPEERAEYDEEMKREALRSERKDKIINAQLKAYGGNSNTRAFAGRGRGRGRGGKK